MVFEIKRIAGIGRREPKPSIKSASHIIEIMLIYLHDKDIGYFSSAPTYIFTNGL